MLFLLQLGGVDACRHLELRTGGGQQLFTLRFGLGGDFGFRHKLADISLLPGGHHRRYLGGRPYLFLGIASAFLIGLGQEVGVFDLFIGTALHQRDLQAGQFLRWLGAVFLAKTDAENNQAV